MHTPSPVIVTSEAADQAAHNAHLAQSHYENFPIATRLLPAKLRRPMYALYAFCRHTDDLGDDLDGDRLAALQTWRADLALCASPNGPSHPILRELRDAAITPFSIPLTVLDRLVEANIRDQLTSRYPTYADVLEYCQYSANPVGEMVLYVFNTHNDTHLALSNHICTGLQLANFWQDVFDDWYNRQRLYIPLEDLSRFGLSEATLHAGTSSQAWRALMSELVGRARDLFSLGQPLEHLVPPNFQFDLTLFRKGGLAILDAIERRNFDVLRFRPTVSKPRFALTTLLTLLTQSLSHFKRLYIPSIHPKRPQNLPPNTPLSLPFNPQELLSLLPDLLPQTPNTPQRSLPKPQIPPKDLLQAQTDCQLLVKAAAGNFYPAFRLLPPHQAHAIFSLYSFCRLADDLVDDPLPPNSPYKTPSLALDALDANTLHISSSLPLSSLPHPSLGPPSLWPTLAHTLHSFPINPQHLLLISNGCRDDLLSSRYPSFLPLARYCFKVSSAVSLITMPIFDPDSPSLLPYSLYGGLAVQLTNILRDIPEDAARDRIYIPQEDLLHFNIPEADLLNGSLSPQFHAMMRFQITRISSLHAAASHRLPLSRRAQHSMLESIRAIYKKLLSHIDSLHGDVFSQRPTLSKSQKLSAALLSTSTHLIQATFAKI